MNENTQVVLVGGGIMSFTLATIINELNPNIQMDIYEILDDVGLESSSAWNNAGTGHAALCELNYTPQKEDGIDISKALKIHQQFEISKEFWAYCVQKGILKEPSTFINAVPHISFVTDNNIDFLKSRHKALQESPFYKNMKFSTDSDEIKQWAPLLIDERDKNQKIAATFMNDGTDVNFGEITHQLCEHLSKSQNVRLHLRHKVLDLNRNSQGGWDIKIKNLQSGQKFSVNSKIVFLGAGGGSFPLVQKSGIQEVKGYAGFPVTGLWLACHNSEVVARHHAKVYGKASVGTPPMSVPHLDKRFIDGKQAILFGPYAGFNTKFLKYGSLTDFPFSVRPNNFMTMLQAGLDNIPLTIYLHKQLLLSKKGRMESLHEYMPSAKLDDWELKVAGQRVQVMKPNAKGRGALEFGTEVVVSQDRSLAALLGASPGASTSVIEMLEVVSKCFSDVANGDLVEKVREMIPSYKNTYEQNIEAYNKNRSKTAQTLKIPFQEI